MNAPGTPPSSVAWTAKHDPELTIGPTARLRALQRMIELFPDEPTITVVDDARRPLGRVVVSAVAASPVPDAAIVRDVMIALR